MYKYLLEYFPKDVTNIIVSYNLISKDEVMKRKSYVLDEIDLMNLVRNESDNKMGIRKLSKKIKKFRKKMDNNLWNNRLFTNTIKQMSPLVGTGEFENIANMYQNENIFQIGLNLFNSPTMQPILNNIMEDLKNNPQDINNIFQNLQNVFGNNLFNIPF